MTREDVLKNPINFLYVFSNNSFEKLIAKYISSKAASAIAMKRANQVKYLTIAYNGNKDLTTAYNEVSSKIQEQFGYTPQAILNKLLKGETVAGKNWKKGVYGIGETSSTNFGDNNGVTVDSSTGLLYQNGVQLDCSPFYSNDSNGNTYISGYSANTSEGNVYTSSKGENGFYSDMYGTAEGMFKANGTNMNASQSSSVWTNIAAATPFIEKLLSWIASLAETLKIAFTPVSTAKTVPSQTEFLTTTKNNDNVQLASVTIIGAALVCGYLLWGRNQKTNK